MQNVTLACRKAIDKSEKLRQEQEIHIETQVMRPNK